MKQKTNAPYTRAKSRFAITAIVCLVLSQISGPISLLPTVEAASSFKPTIFVSTEAFLAIDDDDTTADVVLRFGDTLAKTITFNRSLDRFEINDDVYVTGSIHASNTVSGAVVYGAKSLRSSGSLVWEGAASGAMLYLGGKLEGAGLTDCDSGTSKLLWDATTGRFSCGTIASSTYTAGQGLTLTSTSFKVNDTLTGTLLKFTTATGSLARFVTLSGSTVYAKNSLRSSGSVTWEGIGSGAKLFVKDFVSVGSMASGSLLTVGRVGSGSASLTATNATLFSTDQMALGQLKGGSYFGRVGLTENQWGLSHSGSVWTARESSRTWYATAMSSDGRYQLASPFAGNLYVSSDYGITWQARAFSGNWGTAAMSSDGRFMASSDNNGTVYVSTDYGVNWSSKPSTSRIWRAISMSNDGRFMTAAGTNALYTSNDYGASWTARNTTQAWYGVAMSSDGKIQTAAVDSGRLYVSMDYGATWTARVSNQAWRHVAMSSDGRYQIAGVWSGSLYSSSDYGATWTSSTVGSSPWAVAMSSDGRIRLVGSGKLYASIDYGQTWTVQESSRSWFGAAMSSDGKFRTAVPNTGNIYTSIASSFQYGSVAIGTGSVKGDVKLMVQGILSGVTLYATRSFSGAGLSDCDTAGTSKLLWDATTGRFSCGTDQAGSGAWSNTGSLQTYFDNRYVNTSGDTMTGALRITPRAALGGTGALWLSTAGGPHIMFGSGGSRYDVSLRRTDVGIIALSGSLVPRTTNRFDLGSNALRWRDLFLSGSSLHIGSSTLEGRIGFRDTGFEGLQLFASGSYATPTLFLSSGGLIGVNTATPSQLLHLKTASRDAAVLLQVTGVSGGATSSGPNSGGTFADDNSIGTVTWSNVTDAASSNNVYASASTNGAVSHYLKATNFGFNIPSNATVDGITVEIERYCSMGSINDNAVRIVKGGTIGSTDKSAFGPWATSDPNSYTSYGGAADLWGETWTASDINASNFGVALSATDTLLDAAYVDHIRITVHYTTNSQSGLDWAFGSDFSDESKFKIAQSTTLGTNDLFTLTASGSLGVGTTTPKAKLAVQGILSGVTLYATKSFSGAGLTDCSNGTTSKLLWNATTGRFSCGTDQAGGGIAYATASGIFLKRSGGTMTGTLNIQNGNTHTATATPLLNVRGTMSGRGLFVTGTGAFQAPLIATSLSFGTILMGTGAMKTTGSGKIMPQLFVAGRQPVLAGSGKTATTPRGLGVQGSYVYVGTQGALQTFDVSVPTNPKIVSTPVASTTYSVFPAGKYLVAATTAGVSIFDLTNPGTPNWIATYTTSCSSNARDAAVQGRFMYAACTGNGLFHVVDIADPSTPTYVASITSTGIYRIKIEGDYAYVIETGGTFRVIDISDPTRPSSVGSVSVGTNPQGLYVQGRYAYVANYGSSTVSIIDISTPSTPTVTSTFSTGASSGPQEVYVQGRTMYVTNYDGNNFMVVDVSNPNAPVTTATYSVPAGSNPYGLWVQGRYAYVGLRTKSDLYVFDLGGTYNQQLEAGSAEVGSLNVRRNFDAVDGTFRGGILAQSAFFQGGVAIDAGSGAFALRIQDGGIRMNGGVFSVLPGTTPRTMSGIDLNANVNNVFVAGNYLYTVSDSVTGNEFRVTDIANPDKPVIVGGLDTGQNTKALFVSTRNAFIGMNGTGAGSGMYILDITNPGSPSINSRLNFQSAVNSLYVSGKYIYVGLNAMTGGRCDAKYQLFNGCDFAIVDFSNPNIPRVVGGLQMGATVNQVYVQNRYAYLALDSVSGNDFRIIDLANIQSPQAIGGIDYNNNVKSVFASGKYAFIGLSADASPEFRVVDITNKTSPTALSGLETTVGVNSIVVNGDWARLGLLSGASYGFLTVDLRNPASPASFGGIGYGLDVYSVSVAGKYAYLGRQSTTGNDAVIVDLAGIDSPTASIGSLFAANLYASDNVRFDNNAYVRNALNVGRGGIISKGGLTVQTTGTGSAKGGTGTLMNALEVRNGTGQHLFSVSENGTVQAGLPSFSTGTMMIALNMMSRRSGYCTPLITSATTYTSVGMSTCNVNGTATAWPAGGRMKLKIVAANTASAMAGITTVFTETRPQFRPKILFDVTTGTGTTGLRFYGGIVESSTAAQALTVTSAASTIDYVALAWEDGISGTQWLCCSGDGTNHSCQSMGVPVQTSTEYMGQVDWSQPGRVTCSLQVRDKTYRLTKTTNISVANVSLGENVVLVNKSIGGAVSRAIYNSRLVLEQN